MPETTDSGRPAVPPVAAAAAAAARTRHARKVRAALRRVSPVEATLIKVSTVIAVWLGY